MKDNMIEREAGLLLDAGGITGSRGGMSTGFGVLLKKFLKQYFIKAD